MDIDETLTPEFKELDDLLKCGICHECTKTPVLTSCSHSYCSICIRKWLTTKAVCPACSESVYESSLKKNPLLESIIEAVERIKRGRRGTVDNANDPKTQAKSHLLSSPSPQVNNLSQVIGEINSQTTPKIKVRKDLGPSTSKYTPQQVHAGTKQELECNLKPKETPPRTPNLKQDDKSNIVSSQTTPNIGKSPAVVKVTCPVCSGSIPESIINVHLDKCLNGGSSTRSTANAKTDQAASPSYANQRNAQQNPSVDNLEPIKKMVYNLMPDTQLKKELRKYGLLPQGDRKTLTGRLQRYVIMHNAECDATYPRTQEELRKHFEKEEKALLSSSTNSNKFSQLFKTKKPDQKEFDAARKEYIKQNDQSFKSLITQIKNRKAQPVTLVSSDEEDDPEVVPVPRDNLLDTELDTDSDRSATNTKTTPSSQKNAKKNVKRKCIESESEDDEIQPGKRRSKERSSPVLVSKTPVRRNLRSSRRPSKVAGPARATRSKKPSSPISDVIDRAVEAEMSLFDSPSPASTISEIPCGQPRRSRADLDTSEEEQEEDGGNLSELVSLIDGMESRKEDSLSASGSSTEFED